MATLKTTDGELLTGLHLLEAGIPMTLLLDLASGPHSRDLYLAEQADLDWVTTTPPSRVAV